MSDTKPEVGSIAYCAIQDPAGAYCVLYEKGS